MMHRRRRPLFAIGPFLPLALAGLGALLSIAPTWVLPVAAAAPPLGALPPTPLANGPCGGAKVAPTYTGTLGVLGGGSPPSVSNQTIRALYDYQLDYTPKGGSTSVSCSTGSATASTDALGHFSLTQSIPASGCTPGGCANYTGPFAPTSFSVASPTPAGYFVSAAVSGSTVSLSFVYALASAGLTPFGRTTVSALAPVVLTASGIAGDGTASPAALTFSWLLSGAGWVIDSGAGTSRLTVSSGSGAGTATIVVYVNGTFNGTAESAPARNAILSPAATALVATSVSPTSFDVGAPATFSLTGSGAAGYVYTATIFPGLGLGPVSRTCSGTPASGGLLTLACSVVVTYPSAGIAQPSANLTNGYSTATASFASVTVAPALSLVLSPAPARGYIGSPVGFTLSVGLGSGTAPFGPACFWPGDGTLSCAAAGATTWSFQHVFGQSGSFSGHATVVDAAGANRSVSVVTLISVVPSLSGIAAANGSTVMRGTALPLSAVYQGGALPAQYWWNDSLPGTTLSLGTLTRDGTLVYAYVPNVAGSHLLTLTVVDGLGTVKRSQYPVTVEPGPMSAIVPVGGAGPWSTIAGSPYNVSWVIVDPSGAVVPSGVPLSLTPLEPGAMLWVNHTGFGPIVPSLNGSFDFSGSDWHLGYLNFSISSGVSGAVAFSVRSALPVTEAVNGTLTLNVAYDRWHLVLRDPVGAPSGGVSRTLWRIADRFLNPVPSGFVIIQTNVSGAVSQVLWSPVLFNGTVSVVWVNFSLPSGVAGEVVVRSIWGQTLLPPYSVSAPAPASSLELIVLIVLATLAVVCLAVGIRSPTPPTPVPSTRRPPDPDEAELRRLAAGREFVLSRADPSVPRDLADLVRGFPGIPPTPTELAEWVGSLVNEGELRASLGPDGRPRFTRRNPDDPEPPATSIPRVELDPKILEAALAERPDPGEPDDEPPRD